MGEQRVPAVVVERLQRRPQMLGRLRQLLRPGFVAGIERAGGGAVVQPRRLGGEAGRADGDLQAGVAGRPVEQGQAHRMQHREVGGVPVIGQGVAQGEGAMGGQLGQQPVGQGFDALVLLGQVGQSRR